MASNNLIGRAAAGLLIIMLTLLSRANAEDLSFSLISYNTFLRSPVWMFRDDHDLRAPAIPGQLSGYDVVVLQEAFSDRHREQMLEALAAEYPHHSNILGSNELFSTNGGVVVTSRWPIVDERQFVFSDCNWPDCMVKKGVIYLKIDRAGQPVHVFSLHMQAERKFGATRRLQLRELQDYIESLAIPEHELMLIAGDFNVDYMTRDNDGEFDFMLETLSATVINDALMPTYESAGNTMLDGEFRERLDYILVPQRLQQFLTGNTEVKLIRDAEKDLSDHHAVAAYLRWGMP